METSQQLADILTKYAVPDKNIVGKLPRGGTQLDFVGHADITKILIEIDPLWSWQPCGWENGRPAITVVNGMAVMWGILTVHGKDMIGVGTVKHDKADVDKELIGDFLRNSAMRFGICLSLWTKQEWEDLGETPKKPARPVGTAVKQTPQPYAKPEPTVTQASSDELLSQKQREDFEKACKDKGFSTIMVAQRAGLKWDNSVKVSDLPALRAAWHDFKNEKAEVE